ncbi:MAG TPA: efflux RND transporter periplasmic adaptor subunit [Burkholderiaceae bacterium]
MTAPRIRRAIAAVIALATLGALHMAGLALDFDWFKRKTTPAELTLSGNIEAHESQLSFKGVQSRIVELPFEEGASVRAGTILAKVDDADLVQQVAVADSAVTVQERQLAAARQNLEAALRVIDADRASLAQRGLDLRRAEDLQRQGFLSDAALDAARTAIVEARAVLARDQALAQAASRNIATLAASSAGARESARLGRIQARYATLVAPFDGVITARDAELGEVVAPGTPVVTVTDLDHVWVRAYLNETDLLRVRLGQRAEITTDTPRQRPLDGRLSFIASEAEFTPKNVETHAERVTLVYRVKIDVDNRDRTLLPGMPVDVLLPVASP